MKNILLWIVIAIILISVFDNFGPRQQNVDKFTYSQFIDQVKQGNINNVTIYDTERAIRGESKNGQKFLTYMPMEDPYLMNELLQHKVMVQGKPPEKHGLLMQIFINWFPILLLIAVWIFFMRQMQGGGGRGGPMSFGRSRARMMGEDQVKVTFADVAGIDEAKEEVSELVDFLKDPTKFQRLGGRIPHGALLVGPPGSGKTLLAKAVAGEAKVPFFSISGSDFVEMFVGVGASRVRDMFEQAKRHAPCIIFIDEIDAVGRHRGAGMGGGHDEREQTLNQMLVEMDGFEGKEGVIVMAATNRPDVLDPALLRPGRFDRQITVPLPDVRGREFILQVHTRKVPLDKNVDLNAIARSTPGFSGADLANLANEAALYAARENRRLVVMQDFEKAKDKIIMGAERRTMVMSEDQKKLTAYHEAGHAIVGLSTPGHDPVYKISIIPRGRALGVTMFVPEEDRYNYSLNYLTGQLAGLFGGRVAEEVIYGRDNITTGASNDIEKATEIAKNMVTKWGLSEKLGPITYSERDDQPFLGRGMSQTREISEGTAALIDAEVKSIVEASYQKATEILKSKMDILHLMADALMKYETIEGKQIDDVMAGKPARAPEAVSDEAKPKKQKVDNDAAKPSTGGVKRGRKPKKDQGNDTDQGNLEQPEE